MRFAHDFDTGLLEQTVRGQWISWSISHLGNQYVNLVVVKSAIESTSESFFESISDSIFTSVIESIAESVMESEPVSH